MTNHSKVLHFLWHSFCSEKGQPCLSAMQLLVFKKKAKCLRRHCFLGPLGGGIVLARKPSVPTGIEWQGFICSYRQMRVKCDKTWKSKKVLLIKICTDHSRCTCSCYGSVRRLQLGERDGQIAVCTAKNEMQIRASISKRIPQNNVRYLGLGKYPAVLHHLSETKVPAVHFTHCCLQRSVANKTEHLLFRFSTYKNRTSYINKIFEEIKN